MDKQTRLKFKELKKLLDLNRLSILEMLIDRETCVCEIVRKTGLKHNLVSHHLKVLSDLDYITSDKQGLHVLYSLIKDKSDNVIKLFNFINEHYE